MKKKTNVLKTGCLRFFWAVIVIFLCAAPCVWAETVSAGETKTIDYSITNDWLDVYGTANLEPGAYVDWGIYAWDGGILNIKGGTLGAGYSVNVFSGSTVTVFGTDFADSLGPISTDQWDPTGGGGNVLTVTYTDGNGNPNGDPVNLLFLSAIPINLVNTAVSDPSQLIQALIDTVTGMNLQQGIDNSLDAKLDAALGALDDVNQNNDAAAINTLQAFINAVEAQCDNKITSDQADILIADAQAIIDLLST